MTLTDSIALDLRRRLAADPSLDLRLEALAATYKVSTQPVRLALAQLRREGAIAKRNNGSFRPRSTGTTSNRKKRSSVSIPPPALPEAAAAELHRKFSELAVQLSLRGEDTFLREESVAAQFNVSRSLAREVFQRLRGEGIIEHVPRRGWRVRPFSREDMADFLEVREVLEVRALTLAWPKLERDAIEDFLRANRPGASRADNRLHNYWIERSGNRYIRSFFAQHAPFFATLFDWEEHDRAAARQTIEQHRAILEAILAGDRVAAISALVTHIHDNHPVLSRWPAGDRS